MDFLASDFYLTVGWKYQQNDRRAMLGQGLVWQLVVFSRPAAAADQQPQVVVKPHDLTQSSFVGIVHDCDGKPADKCEHTSGCSFVTGVTA